MLPALSSMRPLLTCATAHFFSFHFSPIHSIPSFTTLNTLSNLLSEAANAFKSSMYNKWVTFWDIGLDNLYPYVALSFHAMGFRHSVKRAGQRASPCGDPFLKRMISDVSRPCFVSTTIRVFQLAASFFITVPNHLGNL